MCILRESNPGLGQSHVVGRPNVTVTPRMLFPCGRILTNIYQSSAFQASPTHRITGIAAQLQRVRQPNRSRVLAEHICLCHICTHRLKAVDLKVGRAAPVLFEAQPNWDNLLAQTRSHHFNTWMVSCC
jgi:hypothetical protein